MTRYMYIYIYTIVRGLSVSSVDGTGLLGGWSISTYNTVSAGLLEVALLGEIFFDSSA